jgi:hypothetical protein
MIFLQKNLTIKKTIVQLKLSNEELQLIIKLLKEEAERIDRQFGISLLEKITGKTTNDAERILNKINK